MKNLIYTLLLVTLIPALSCKKVLDVDSTRAISEENMWNKLEDARAGLFAIYALNRAALTDNGRHHIYGEVRLADFDAVSRDDLKAIHNNLLTADFPLVSQLSDWRRFYATINAANIFIERSKEVFDKDPRYVKQNFELDLAQAKALRAFSYFYITRIWGDVPLILTSDEKDFERKGRNPQAEVLAQAELDLLEAEPKLPYAYDGLDPEQTGSYYGNGIGAYDLGLLMTRQGVWATLANLYAWQGNYASASRYAQLIMDKAVVVNNQTGFRLDNAFFPLNERQATRVFRGSSLTETRTKIFGIPHNWRSAEYAYSGCMEELTLAAPVVTNRSLPAIYVPKDTMLAIYDEPGDTRFSLNPVTKKPVNEFWFTGFDKKYPIFRKIIATNDQGGIDVTIPIQYAAFASTIIFSRFEDNALLLAESKAALNDLAGAVQMLDAVRKAHNLPVYDPAKNGPVLDAVFKERRRELIGEGWRWYDLIRYKKIRNNDEKFNKLIEEGGIYWPISQAVLNQNPLLIQYPHWR